MLENRIVASSIMIVAAAFAAAAVTMPMGTATAPGPGLVPLLLSVATAIAAASALVASFRTNMTDSSVDADTEVPPLPLKAAVICATIMGTIFLFERVGFLASSFLCVFILLRFVEKKPLLLSIIVPAVLSGGCHLVFTYVLRMNLP